ncbi:MAG: hypothetical protein J6U97_05045 [Bacteroidaceae bacterium]|nr:hypothetical protein [Bacteroidaceae bacterium]
MTIDDVIALSKAGFTSEQILQMSQVKQQPIQQPVMQPQVQQIQQPVMQPQIQQPVMPQVQQFQQPVIQTPVPAPAPAPEQQKDPFQQLFEQMTGIKQAIQTSNIQNSQMTPAAPQTTDDILASIIQPTKPKEDK